MSSWRGGSQQDNYVVKELHTTKILVKIKEEGKEVLVT